MFALQLHTWVDLLLVGVRICIEKPVELTPSVSSAVSHTGNLE